jgi:hypothetical protein
MEGMCTRGSGDYIKRWVCRSKVETFLFPVHQLPPVGQPTSKMLFSGAFAFALFAAASSSSVNANEVRALNAAQCNIVGLVVTALRKEAGASSFCSSLLHIGGATATATATVTNTLSVVATATNLFTSTQTLQDVVTATGAVVAVTGMEVIVGETVTE